MGLKPGWNWWAFLHSSAWFAYRRLYFLAALNLLAPWVLLIGTLFATQGLGNDASLFAVLAAFALYLLAAWIAVPVFADALYARRMQAAPLKPPSAWTGAAAAAAVVLSLPIILFMVAPAHDPTQRDKISEALLAASSMRSGIAEFFAEKGRLPDAAEAARFRLSGKDTGTRYAESIVYDAQAQRIVITLREVHPGKRIALQVVLRDGKIDRFACGPLDLEAKHLPGSCRN
jgi:hypothetical protein